MPLGSLWGLSVSPIQESATSHRIISLCALRGGGGGRGVVDQEGFRQSNRPHFLPQVLILCHIKELGLHLGHREAFS